MYNNADCYTEVLDGSIIRIKGANYLVVNGFVIVYPNRILCLDGARLEKLPK